MLNAVASLMVSEEAASSAREVWDWLDGLRSAPDASVAYNDMVEVVIMGPLSAAEILILVIFCDLLPPSDDTEFSRQTLRSLQRLRSSVPDLDNHLVQATR